MLNNQEGAKCKAVCSNCGGSVSATHKSETISLCEGLEEIDNVLSVICDKCGSICSIPYKSIEPVQDAIESLIKSKAVSGYGEITIELKSQVEARTVPSDQLKSDYQYDPIVASG